MNLEKEKVTVFEGNVSAALRSMDEYRQIDLYPRKRAIVTEGPVRYQDRSVRLMA